MRADGFERPEGNTLICKWLANECRSGVEEPGMMYNVCVATRETHDLLLKEYDLQRNKRRKSNESMGVGCRHSTADTR